MALSNSPGQKFHHSLKEHHKISNIPKFRCEIGCKMRIIWPCEVCRFSVILHYKREIDNQFDYQFPICNTK